MKAGRMGCVFLPDNLSKLELCFFPVNESEEVPYDIYNKKSNKRLVYKKRSSASNAQLLVGMFFILNMNSIVRFVEIENTAK